MDTKTTKQDVTVLTNNVNKELESQGLKVVLSTQTSPLRVTVEVEELSKPHITKKTLRMCFSWKEAHLFLDGMQEMARLVR